MSASRSRSGSRGRHRKGGAKRDRRHGEPRERRRRAQDREQAPPFYPPADSSHGPPGYHAAFGGYPAGPGAMMHWGPQMGGVGPPAPYGMGQLQPHRGASTMPDDGVSMQVSEKFLMRNDYCQTFIDTGQRPQNYIRDLVYANRYSEYPKIERLVKLKSEILGKRATPSMSLKCDLKTFDLSSLGTKFDVLLLDPPWEEYQTRVAGMYVPQEDLEAWSFEEMRQLKIGEIADTQSFCFLWCGETHLEQARELLKRWGFRRVEDICWVKTNRLAEQDTQGRVKQQTVMYGDTSIVQRAKEHCVVGVKGTLKRSVDTHFIHANCDVDLIMEEEKEFGSTQKPTELYETIEHFCLGRRRLELFGLDRNLRDGWLTLGRGLTTSNWNKDAYLGWFEGDVRWPQVQNYFGGRLLGSAPEIDQLRPKSPVRSSRHRAPSPGRGDDEERPLPEDLGEMAPPIPKEEDDEYIPPAPMNMPGFMPA